jgi:hypothetical protein
MGPASTVLVAVLSAAVLSGCVEPIRKDSDFVSPTYPIQVELYGIDNGTEPLGGIEVEVFGENGNLAKGLTDSAGVFSFRLARGQNFTFRASPPGWTSLRTVNVTIPTVEEWIEAREKIRRANLMDTCKVPSGSRCDKDGIMGLPGIAATLRAHVVRPEIAAETSFQVNQSVRAGPLGRGEDEWLVPIALPRGYGSFIQTANITRSWVNTAGQWANLAAIGSCWSRSAMATGEPSDARTPGPQSAALEWNVGDDDPFVWHIGDPWFARCGELHVGAHAQEITADMRVSANVDMTFTGGTQVPDMRGYRP